eukprot:TRINITY_DN2400_c0_g1_i1.p1 TRINITY_DN2400_c0_g1~~TRINITY_DN2400_c0_g1_i1.p1  ORF type:complete len:169 (-),score=37.73 TRINITY_DN2400_c0_g1_i1:479-985(-)
MSETKLRLGFTCSQRYREEHTQELEKFVLNDFLWLVQTFEVLITEGTKNTLLSILKLKDPNKAKIIKSLSVGLPPRKEGLVALTFELIEGRMGAVFQLTSFLELRDDLSQELLRRQSEVHNIVYASTLKSVGQIVKNWKEGSPLPKLNLINNQLRLDKLHAHPAGGKK